MPLEASFNLFNVYLPACLPAPLGMWGSGRGSQGWKVWCGTLAGLPILSYCTKAGLKESGAGVLFHLLLDPQVLVPVACVWVISALLGLSAIPLELSAPSGALWFWLPHPGTFAPSLPSLY